MLTRDATLDFELVGRLGARVDVPLVLHGSSGVPDPDLARAVAAGITKVNISTRLAQAFTAAVRARLEEDPSVVDTRAYLGPAREAVAAEVGRALEVLGQGRAAPPSSRKS
jgi:fructose-bisphosphate aldolase class II